MLLQKLREESRAVFLQRKSRELLDNEELQVKDDKSVHLLLYPKDGCLRIFGCLMQIQLTMRFIPFLELVVFAR